MLEHGGRVRRAASCYGIPECEWLDLSTGINPHAYPVPPLPDSVWQHLPEGDDELVAAACGYYGTFDLLPVSGSQAAIQALPVLFESCTVAFAGTSYAEHEHAWRKQGHRVQLTLDDELLSAEADVVVIVNPNNPTGKSFSAQQLLELHEKLLRRGGTLVVDEAFVDASPQLSLAPFCPRDGLIVLRSLGKFFGLAGARVGFVLASPSFLSRLEKMLGPWPIAAPSRYVAAVALQDFDWQQAARTKLTASGQRLKNLLGAYGLEPCGSNALFQWVTTTDAALVHEHLAKQGILTRLFSQSLRFGLPRDEVDWARLELALHGLAR